QILVGEAGPFQHRPRPGAVGTVEDDAALVPHVEAVRRRLAHDPSLLDSTRRRSAAAARTRAMKLPMRESFNRPRRTRKGALATPATEVARRPRNWLVRDAASR